MRYQIRQGDVLLVPIDAIPAGAVAVPREAGRVVLAHGEVTGHAHAFTGTRTMLMELPEPIAMRMFSRPVSRFVTVPEPDTLWHEEHTARGVAADNVGAFAVITPREYTPWGDRAVLD